MSGRLRTKQAGATGASRSAAIIIMTSALLIALFPGVASAPITTIPSANGHPWDVDVVTGDIGDGGSDAFDNWGYLRLQLRDANDQVVLADSGAGLSGFGLTLDGRYFHTTTPVTAGGVQVGRDLFAPDGTDYLRYLDSFTNTTTGPLTVEVSWGRDLGSDTRTSVAFTSSGDRTLTAADNWAVTIQEGDAPPFDGVGQSTDPPVGYALGTMGNTVYGGPGDVFTGGSTFDGGLSNPFTAPWPGDADDDLGHVYRFPLGPGETRSLAYFLYRGIGEGFTGPLGQPAPADGAEAAGARDAVAALTASPNFADLTPTQIAQILNWNLDGPPPGQPDTATGTAPSGGTVTTDSSGDGATPSDPVETSVTSPSGGQISIEETQPTQNLGEFQALGQQINIEAPLAEPSNPLVLEFSFDASLLPDGENENTVEIFRNGAQLPACSQPGGSVASPDPCVSLRERLPDGDVRITVLTSAASEWNAGLRPPRQIQPGPPPACSDGVDNDGDGLRDFPADPGCASSADTDETGTSSPSPQPTVTEQSPTTTPAATTAPPISPTATSAAPPGDTTPPQAEASADPDAISPNGDGRNDSLTVTAAFSEPTDWDFVVTSSSSTPGPAAHQSETVVFSTKGSGAQASISWDGTGPEGPAGDGRYVWRLTGSDAAGNELTPVSGIVTVDTERPAVTNVTVRPQQITRDAGRVSIAFTVDEASRVTVTIRDRDNHRVRGLNRKRIDGPEDLVLIWNGRGDEGGLVRNGTYTVRIKAVDAAGNKGVDRSKQVVVRR